MIAARKLTALWCLAAMLLGQIAEAKVLLVDNYAASGHARPFADIENMEARQRRLILDVFQRFNVDYKAVPITSMKTEFFRTGLVGYNRASGVSSATEQFDAVIHNESGNSYVMGYTSTGNPPWPPNTMGGCYACSLTVGGVTAAPLVPQLFLSGADNANQAAGWFRDVSAATKPCSTGVTAYVGAASGANQHTPFTTGAWLSTSAVQGYPINGTPPTGGFRKWLICNSTAFASNGSPDSTVPTADTVSLWERPMTGLYQGASNTNPIKPMLFANIMGGGICGDSAGRNVACEGDAFTLLLALARLDSLTGGAVFKGPPMRAAVVLFGGFQRTTRILPGGANNADSVVIKASIDSLAALHIPITLSVDVDSIASYPNEIAWWTQRGLNIRFSPMTTYAAKDTSGLGASLAWTVSRPLDIFGMNHNRAFIGDSTGTVHAVTGADSSICAGLLAARAIATTNGLLPISGTITAQADDWSPKNMRNKGNALDSLVLAFQAAGFSAAVTDVQRGDADVFKNAVQGRNADRVNGWFGRQYTYNNKFSGKPFSFVGHTGYRIAGGPATSITLSIDMYRFWAGLAHPGAWNDLDAFNDTMTAYDDVSTPTADGLYHTNTANVLKLHVSDLSGASTGQNRAGYWLIKHIKRQFDAINAVAGRTIITFAFPEDINP